MPIKRSDYITIAADELQLFKAMLLDKLINHKLEELIEDICIIRLRYPEDMGKFPGIALMTTGLRSVTDCVDETGNYVDEFTKTIVVDIYCMENQEITYNGIRYKGAENVLTVIRDIVYRIVSENQTYENESCTGITFDTLTIIGESWTTMYRGISDCSAVQLRFDVQYEKVR